MRNVSSDQLFFLYYALDNCEHSGEAFKLFQYRTSGRLPPEYQVNFPLRHLPQFSEAFNCGSGTAMRLPEDAICSVFNRSAADYKRCLA